MLLIALCLIGCSWNQVQSVEDSSSPHVVIVIGCTLRADQTALYDHRVAWTPFLSNMVQKGTVMVDTITAAPWTKPSSVALWTGQHASALGMVEPLDRTNDLILPEGVDTLAERFKQQGYNTIGVVANPNVAAVFGFGQGFDEYWAPDRLWRNGRERPVRADNIVAKALQLTAQSSTEAPRLLVVMMVDTHQPVAPHPQVDDWSVPGAPQVGPYRGSVAAFDRALSDLWLGLQHQGLSEKNSQLWVLNDHGEGLNWPPHHGPAHGRHLVPSTIHGVWAGMGKGIPEGRAFTGLVSQTDVLPTVLAAAGLPADSSEDSVNHWPNILLDHGVSSRLFAVSETYFQDVAKLAWVEPTKACVVDLVGSADEAACFDRRRDPSWSAAHMESGLDPRIQQWRSQADVIGKSAAAETVDQVTEAQLRALGYLD